MHIVKKVEIIYNVYGSNKKIKKRGKKMTAQLVGVKTVSFEDSKTGKMIEGESLFIVRKPSLRESSDVIGNVADKIWLPKNSSLYGKNDGLVGKTLDFVYESEDGKHPTLVAVKPASVASAG